MLCLSKRRHCCRSFQVNASLWDKYLQSFAQWVSQNHAVLDACCQMAMVANLTQHCEVQLPDVPIGLDLLQSPIMLFICKFTDLPAGPPHCSSLILGCFGLYGEWPPN